MLYSLIGVTLAGGILGLRFRVWTMLMFAIAIFWLAFLILLLQDHSWAKAALWAYAHVVCLEVGYVTGMMLAIASRRR